jgi:nitrite reductase/ring-hydroxylating ferredoxin subunit
MGLVACSSGDAPVEATDAGQADAPEPPADATAPVDASTPDAAKPVDASKPDTSPGVDAGCAPTGKNVGASSNFALGTWSLVGPYIVAHDKGGLFAFSAICTHQGCTVDPPAQDGSTLCACHGSRFDGNGAVLKGPANKPLMHFGVQVCAGIVYVDPFNVVPASTRTPA